MSQEYRNQVDQCIECYARVRYSNICLLQAPEQTVSGIVYFELSFYKIIGRAAQKVPLKRLNERKIEVI